MQEGEPLYVELLPNLWLFAPIFCFNTDRSLEQDVNVLKLNSERGEATQLQQLGWVEGKFRSVYNERNV